MSYSTVYRTGDRGVRYAPCVASGGACGVFARGTAISCTSIGMAMWSSPPIVACVAAGRSFAASERRLLRAPHGPPGIRELEQAARSTRRGAAVRRSDERAGRLVLQIDRATPPRITDAPRTRRRILEQLGIPTQPAPRQRRQPEPILQLPGLMPPGRGRQRFCASRPCSAVRYRRVGGCASGFH